MGGRRRAAPPRRPPLLWRALRRTLLDVGAVAGAACLLLAVAAPLLGVRPLIFLSGSMAPTIPAGSLALSRVVPAAEVRVGDVLTVPVGQTYVTHRVVEVTHRQDGSTVRLQGDANRTPDPVVHEIRSAPRLLGSVPHLGSMVAWFSRPPGVFLLAAYVLFLLDTLRRGRTERPQGGRRISGTPAKRRRAAAPRRGQALAGAGVAALVVPVTLVPPAHAAWVDTVPVSGTTLGTVSPQVPTVSCAPLGVPGVRLSWTSDPNATGYRLHYGLTGLLTEDVAASVTHKDILVLGTGVFRVQAIYGNDSWISAPSNDKLYEVLLAVGVCL